MHAGNGFRSPQPARNKFNWDTNSPTESPLIHNRQVSTNFNSPYGSAVVTPRQDLRSQTRLMIERSASNEASLVNGSATPHRRIIQSRNLNKTLDGGGWLKKSPKHTTELSLEANQKQASVAFENFRNEEMESLTGPMFRTMRVGAGTLGPNFS